MKVIDYYKKGLDGEGFPPPETFDSEYEFDEAWKEYTRGQNERYENKYKGKKLYTDRGVKVFESQLKKRIRKIVEASCGKSRVREMDYEQEDEDPAELARFDALNNSKDEMLYRDNPIYREAYDEMTMKESRRRRNIILESRAERILGLPRDPSPMEVYMAAMKWMSGKQNPSSDPDAGLVDKVIHNTMVKHQIAKNDDHVGSKLNMIRRILDPDLARRQSYRAGIEDEMRRLDPTGDRQRYEYMTPNTLRMGESKRRIRKIVQEANMDGTISDDEDFLEDQLLEYVEIEIDELIQFIEIESEKIGGGFRAPAIRQRAISLAKGKLNRSSRK